MKWTEFHHPDVSFPVVRRRIAQDILEMLQVSALFMSRGGWAVMNQSCYPDRKAYRNAMYRLRKSGLVVQRNDEGYETPRLELSEAAAGRLPAYFDAPVYWRRKWKGIWYMLVYDVPEKDRAYRDVLRQFLKTQRLGCLQQSVWLTPEDMRPQFNDLVDAAAIDSFAFLFESRTVLGLPSQRVVEQAWNMELLHDIQRRYCTVAEENLSKLAKGCGVNDAAELMGLALAAFHTAFFRDPLLPENLLPRDYLGKRAWELHRRLMKGISQQVEVSK